MLRRLAIMAGIGGAALTGGCADVMQQSYISQIAPEWFEAKAVEVKGEGYPELSDVPETRAVAGGTQQEWEGRAEALKAEAASMEAKLNAEGGFRTDDEVRATAAQWRACVEEGRARCPDEPAPAAKPGR
jgi:hypothetical protein